MCCFSGFSPVSQRSDAELLSIDLHTYIGGLFKLFFFFLSGCIIARTVHPILMFNHTAKQCHDPTNGPHAGQSIQCIEKWQCR